MNKKMKGEMYGSPKMVKKTEKMEVAKAVKKDYGKAKKKK
jgi:hypothetical protein